MSVTHKNPYTPPWYRRLLFLGTVTGVAAWVWYKYDQAGFDRNMARLSGAAVVGYHGAVEFFRGDGHQSLAVTLR